jgi:undecaprenyl-diphosphatase
VDFAVFAGFDAAVIAAIRSVSSPELTRVMWLATVSGDAAVMVVWTAIAVVLLWAWGRRRPAVVLAVLMLVDPVLVSLLKNAFARPRPPLASMLVTPPTGLSFPSGHATATLVFYGFMTLATLGSALPLRRTVLIAFAALGTALLVGGSRVYLGVHYPSDVIGGWVFADMLMGAGWGALALWDRLAGPEKAPASSLARTVRLGWFSAACTVAAVAALLLQAGADPLLG